MKTVCLFTQGTDGDVLPFLKVGQYLRSMNYSVCLFSHAIYDQDQYSDYMEGITLFKLDTIDQHSQYLKDLMLLADPIENKEEYIKFICISSELKLRYNK